MSTTIAPAPSLPAPTTSHAGDSVPEALSPEPYRFTVDQYERMAEVGILTEADRVELINGIVVTKMAKGPAHIWVVKQAGRQLEVLLGAAFSLRLEAPARIPPLNEPEPDLLAARGDDARYLKRHPEPHEIALVVEVSDTTYHRDRYEKYPAFALARIPAYWIVNLPKRCVEVHTDPGPEGYRSQQDYHPGAVVPVTIDGVRLGEIAVDDILPPSEAAEAPAEGNGA
ncbi:MAG: Uma2 family endonuclease [Isosphaeraceae bacterium]